MEKDQQEKEILVEEAAKIVGLRSLPNSVGETESLSVSINRSFPPEKRGPGDFDFS